MNFRSSEVTAKPLAAVDEHIRKNLHRRVTLGELTRIAGISAAQAVNASASPSSKTSADPDYARALLPAVQLSDKTPESW